MILFIKKIKTHEGINFLDKEKIKKDIPKGFRTSNDTPTVTLTSNNVIIAFECEKVAKPIQEAKPKKKATAKVKKKAIA